MWLQGELFFPVRLIGRNTLIVKEPIAVVDEANSKKGALLSPHNGQTRGMAWQPRTNWQRERHETAMTKTTTSTMTTLPAAKLGWLHAELLLSQLLRS